MLRYTLLAALLLAGIFTSHAAQRLYGRITDTAGAGLAGVSISLLDPADSTLSVFGVSSDKGDFAIADVKEGTYLMQVALMGYYTTYRPVSVPHAGGDLGTVMLGLNEAANLLNEVVISGEKVPLRIKGDTLEYNAGSYKVKPDAVVEDLLRKMPGIQVDKEGNIKSMGKDVSKVLVDGKEFFGNDPKIATKNLPADAIDKIQAFEKKSDQSLFTGIDDGQREQTLNLLLKDGKKQGYFGEVSGGVGIPEKYEGSLRAFKFREKSQLAVLGMLNNINKFGFTFEDYLNFNGGISSLLSSGGRLELNPDEVPVDFGLPVTGDVTSGAAGLNYTLEPWKDSRLNLSYMGNGMKKFLDQRVKATNYTPDGNFEKRDSSISNSDNLNHRLALNWRNTIDTVHQLNITAYGQLADNGNTASAYSESYMSTALQNYLDNKEESNGRKIEFGGGLNWVRKSSGKWPVLKAVANAMYSSRKDESWWNNLAYYALGNNEVADQQYRDNLQSKTGANLSLSAVRNLGKGYYLEPSLGADWERAANNRRQGPLGNSDIVTDSLSPDFYRDVREVFAGLQLQHNHKGQQWHIGLKAQGTWLSPYMNGVRLDERSYSYLLPAAFLQQELGTGQRLSLRYNTSITVPDALQLLPVTDYSNPLLWARGNPDLRPEYVHNLGVNYNFFDQFNMSSFFIALSGSYTHDKIGWDRVVLPDLSQRMQTVNTGGASGTRMNVQYERPVRKLGMNFSLGLSESWTRTESPVNGIRNRNNSWSHQLEFSGNNTNNDIWDIRYGGSVTLSTAQYSLNKELNNTYTNYTAFATLGFRPSAKWNFGLSGDLTHYTASSFDQPVTVPLLKAEVSRYFFSNQRGSLTLRGFDLLDRNKAVLRSSQLNYLMEQRSNIIGRYVMLSFAYKLNRAGSKAPMPGGIQIRQR